MECGQGASVASSGKHRAGAARPDGYRLQLPIQIRVTIHLPDGPLEGQTELLGLRGAILDVPRLQRRGAYGLMSLHLPDGEVGVWGNLPAMHNDRWLAQFIAVQSSARERLYHFLAERAGVFARVRSPRIALSIPVLIRHGGKLWTSHSVDLSSTGMLLVTPEPLMVGGLCRLRLQLEDRVFWTDTVVARVDGNQAGLMFERMEAADQDFLNQFLADASESLTPIAAAAEPITSDPAP